MDSVGEGEPLYVAEALPSGAVLAPAPAAPPRSRRWWWVAGAAVGVAGAVTAVVIATRSDSTPLGELSARLAAQHFVASVNAGNKDGAAAESCPNFADEARSVAESGKDAGIDFTLGAVHLSGPDAGTVVITQRLHFPGGIQRVAHVVHLDRTNGRWVVCGQD